MAGKTLSLFANDPDLQGWRYGAMLTDLSLPALEVWRLYRGRADCENRIKELKADFGLGSFCLRDFWATEAALGGDDAQLQPDECVFHIGPGAYSYCFTALNCGARSSPTHIGVGYAPRVGRQHDALGVHQVVAQRRRGLLQLAGLEELDDLHVAVHIGRMQKLRVVE